MSATQIEPKRISETEKKRFMKSNFNEIFRGFMINEEIGLAFLCDL